MIAVILLIAFLITGCEDKSVKTDHIIRIGVVTYTQAYDDVGKITS